MTTSFVTPTNFCYLSLSDTLARQFLPCLHTLDLMQPLCMMDRSNLLLSQAETLSPDATGSAENSPDCQLSTAPNDMQATSKGCAQAVHGIFQGKDATVAIAGCTADLPYISPAEAIAPTVRPSRAMLACQQLSSDVVNHLAHSQLPALQAGGEDDRTAWVIPLLRLLFMLSMLSLDDPVKTWCCCRSQRT